MLENSIGARLRPVKANLHIVHKSEITSTNFPISVPPDRKFSAYYAAAEWQFRVGITTSHPGTYSTH